jgi:hypothetical protein
MIEAEINPSRNEWNPDGTLGNFPDFLSRKEPGVDPPPTGRHGEVEENPQWNPKEEKEEHPLTGTQ